MTNRTIKNKQTKILTFFKNRKKEIFKKDTYKIIKRRINVSYDKIKQS